MKAIAFLVLLACTANLFAEPAPADEDRLAAIESIETQIRELAAIAKPASQRLARTLCDVLLKHKIVLPKDLAELKSPAQTAGAGDDEADQIAGVVGNIANVEPALLLANSSGDAAGAPLGVDLLLKILSECDVRQAKLTAAVYLADGLFAPDGLPRFSLDIADGAAERGMEMSFEDVRSELAQHRLSVAARANTMSAVAALAETWAIRLPGLRSTAKDAAEVSGVMEERIVKLEALAGDVVKAGEGNEDMVKFAAAIRDVVAALRKAATETAGKVATANQVAPVLRGFFAAVSADDRAELKKFVTGRGGEQMLAVKSIKDELGRRSGVKEIRLARFPRVSVSGGERETYKLGFVMEVTDNSGEIRRISSAAVAVKENGAWLLGGE